jgi:glycosyltransferase involved in cell wall biosynthesis
LVQRKFRLSSMPYVLVPGTFEPRKNHLRVIKAFRRVLRRLPRPQDLHLVLAGQSGWRSRGIAQAIQAAGLGDQIHVLGYIPDSELAALMTGASAVAYVSLYEGFGLPVVEAMACGAPVITSSVSSMPEVAGDAAILVDPTSEQAISYGIELALGADASFRSAAISQAARFSWERTARATADIYAAFG